MDWHRGVMSSRRLLVLIKHLPQDGDYKLETESTTGWPELTEILAAIHEEIASDNVSKRTEPGTTAMVTTFVPPKDRLARVLEAIAEAEAREAEEEQLYSDMGFS
jgi:hypothetical protein